MIEGFILAFQFLTRLPIRRAVDFNRENLSISTMFFPLVGLVIGGISGIIYYMFSYLNNLIASFFTLLSLVLVTGGLHLDGLSDTCDGFLSYRDRETTLKIMSDSRIGAFGVIGIILALLLKYVLILSFQGKIAILLGLAAGNSRLVVAYFMGSKKPAKNQGIGYEFYKARPKKSAIIGGVVYFLIVLLINPISLISLITTFIVGEIISKISYKKISGLTGDVYGSIIEIGEIISLLTFLVLYNLN